MRKKSTKYLKPSLLLIGLLAFMLWGMEGTAFAKKTTILSDTNLQETINRANAGDTIFLEKGLYQGAITINKPLAISGEEGAIVAGDGKGNVITITANDVTLTNLTIQNSGEDHEDSGVYLDKVENVNISANNLVSVHNGIYLNMGKNNEIANNIISSNEGHFSKRGNGIHIFKGEGHTVHDNTIKEVQDGIYFDFAGKVDVAENVIRDSRYGMHFMFSENISAIENTVSGNITGLMVMDSARLDFRKNLIHHQFHFRGFGVLIYDSQNIILSGNEITQNSVGISFEKARDTEVSRNIIAANQVGLEFRHDNQKNLFYENNFIANIVSSTIGKEELHLDNGVKGNYWDDYSSHDITGDGIGELPYKAGSLYDNLLKVQPLWQFYFESPAMQMWSKAESMFPSMGTVDVYDNKPLIKPVKLAANEQEAREGSGILTLLLGFFFIGISFFTIVKGRSYI